ncbi:hypothetical protein BC831DRAFT_451828 [Entophlyctis helioformis]|nr:hypothetical protein BC831DRAFT_451828 [Entophlyctis helioformis]
MAPHINLITQLPKSGHAIVGIIVNSTAILACLAGVANFVYFGRANKFTTTILCLIFLNAYGALFQTVVMVYLYSDTGTLGPLIARNWMYPINTMLLNLLQLEVYAVFNAGLIRLPLFSRENMPKIRGVAVLIMIVLCGAIFWEGILFTYGDNALVSAYSAFGPLIYCVLVVVWGVTQNIFILRKVQGHIDSLISNDSAGTNTSSATKTRGARYIQALIGLLILLDFIAFACFGASMMADGPVGTIAHVNYLALQQISFSCGGLHMVGETVAFEMIAGQFRKHSSGGSNSTRSRTLGSKSNLSTGSMISSPPPTKG